MLVQPLFCLLLAAAGPLPEADHHLENRSEARPMSGLLENKDLPCPRSKPELKAVIAAAERGEALAEFLLGYYYGNGKCQGLGLHRDPKMAKYWLKKAGDQGHSPALYWAGIYQYMSFNRKDMLESLELFQRSADLGNIDAQLFLAQLYQFGNLVERDPERALRLCDMGAQLGNPQAMFRLGELMLDSGSRIHNLEEGLKWLQRAAKKQYVAAYAALGRAYMEDHRGGKRDLVTAYAWLRLAQESGADEIVNEYIEKLDATLSKEEIRQAIEMKSALP